MSREELQDKSLKTEYIRNLNCNYVRMTLEEKPEESRYQYCILNRGGIRFLLPCSLRYIDGEAYLYYDISSTQNIAQLFDGRTLDREWMRDFLWGMERMQQELSRYLLEGCNVVWNPEQIYQDLEKKDFYFMYVPYCRKDTGFKQLLEFWVEHIDYEDEALVEFVYALHDQYATAGDACLNRQIFEDFKEVEKKEKQRRKSLATEETTEPESMQEPATTLAYDTLPKTKEVSETGDGDRRKGFLSFLGGRRKKQDPVSYQEVLRQQVGMQVLGAVSEESVYGKDEDMEIEEEEYGRTVYLEEQRQEQVRGLYRDNGELAVRIDKLPFVIGKKREEVDYALDDRSVSRVHARILEENGIFYLEDLNSTNGTYKNGLRMQPYEKRQLEKDDELRFGRTEYIFQ